MTDLHSAITLLKGKYIWTWLVGETEEKVPDDTTLVEEVVEVAGVPFLITRNISNEVRLLNLMQLQVIDIKKEDTN